MKCPHCLQHIHSIVDFIYIDVDIDGNWFVSRSLCPACKRVILSLVKENKSNITYQRIYGYNNICNIDSETPIHPRCSMRPPCPPEVPSEIAEVYQEACLVLPDSAKASAALSRRCLQHILRTVAQVRQGDLAKEIQQVLDSNTLPPHLAEMIDAVRNIGNFAAHPQKSQHTGEILPVEEEEAAWNLDVLEFLFDFYYIQPSLIKQKRDALNKKLQEAGKPPMK